MANKFQIDVTATDSATKVVRKINRSMNGLLRPLINAKKSLGSFHNEIGKNAFISAPIKGLSMLGRSVTGLATTFGIAETGILGSASRVAAGIGSIGGPVGGLVAGGVAAAGAAASIAVKMASMGQDVKRTSAFLGITTDELQIYRSVARQAGLSTDTMDASLSTFAANLTGVAAGTMPELNNIMKLMGVDLKKNADGTVNVTQAWRDYMDVVSRIKDPAQQRLAATAAGLEEVLPI
jgi:hypothetical protein